MPCRVELTIPELINEIRYLLNSKNEYLFDSIRQDVYIQIQQHFEICFIRSRNFHDYLCEYKLPDYFIDKHSESTPNTNIRRSKTYNS